MKTTIELNDEQRDFLKFLSIRALEQKTRQRAVRVLSKGSYTKSDHDDVLNTDSAILNPASEMYYKGYEKWSEEETPKFVTF